MFQVNDVWASCSKESFPFASICDAHSLWCCANTLYTSRTFLKGSFYFNISECVNMAKMFRAESDLNRYQMRVSIYFYYTLPVRVMISKSVVNSFMFWANCWKCFYSVYCLHWIIVCFKYLHCLPSNGDVLTIRSTAHSSSLSTV